MGKVVYLFVNKYFMRMKIIISSRNFLRREIYLLYMFFLLCLFVLCVFSGYYVFFFMCLIVYLVFCYFLGFLMCYCGGVYGLKNSFFQRVLFVKKNFYKLGLYLMYLVILLIYWMKNMIRVYFGELRFFDFRFVLIFFIICNFCEVFGSLQFLENI